MSMRKLSRETWRTASGGPSLSLSYDLAVAEPGAASAQVHILNFFELQIVMGISRFRKNPDFATVERA